MRREAEDILSMLCDFFEYSEDEREMMLPKNTKRLFGFFKLSNFEIVSRRSETLCMHVFFFFEYCINILEVF